MNAIEFLKTPLYISNMNTVVPLTTINLYLIDIFNYARLIVLSLINFTTLFTQTTQFISTELFKLLISETNTQLIIIILGACSGFMFLILQEHRNKLNDQTQHIQNLQSQVKYLKKMERIYENEEQNLIQDFKRYVDETGKKIITLEKKIKKMEKEIKIYE